MAQENRLLEQVVTADLSGDLESALAHALWWRVAARRNPATYPKADADAEVRYHLETALAVLNAEIPAVQ